MFVLGLLWSFVELLWGCVEVLSGFLEFCFVELSRVLQSFAALLLGLFVEFSFGLVLESCGVPVRFCGVDVEYC